MPRLWTHTIEKHREEVRDAILDAAARLALERGPLSITMSEIADTAGIGRATLYKYFSDIPTILNSWHEREIRRHLQHLRETIAKSQPTERLTAVLNAWAHITREIQRHTGTDLAAVLHQPGHSATARAELRGLIQDVLREAILDGTVRDDVPVGELADYCLHGLTAAGQMSSTASIRRLVDVTVAGLRPPQGQPGRETSGSPRSGSRRR
ncbi:MAG TPA: TetR/AcrR family transcriptional regulator [Actinomycetota bacterium]|nr:TetR/AcrR family transcriptional regulator [Actinomycetota bacterium]